MPDPRHRIVLVQISDPHFSKDLRNDSVEPIRGYRAHDHLLAQALPVGVDDALEHARATRDEATLVVSGDLTVSGTGGQFRRARQYFDRVLAANRGRDAWGLGWDAERHHPIPGNHDHWDGRMPPYTGVRRPRAFNPDLFPHAARKRNWPPPFARHPWALPVPLRSGPLAVEVYGIDTLSGMAPTATNWRAGGSIDPRQLADLEALLPTAAFDPRRIRVLVMHHPLASSPFAWKTLDTDSLLRVSAFLRRHHFAVVLAGHVHSLQGRPVEVADGPDTGEVLEVRCPSTLQGKPADRIQGFLLHEVCLDAAPSWTTTPWLWSSTEGRFACEDPIVSRLPNSPGEQDWALAPPAP